MSHRLDRMRAMLQELEHLAESAREHEQRMTQSLHDSSSWSRQEDRDWVRRAAADAAVSRKAAEESVMQGRALLERVELLIDSGLIRDKRPACLGAPHEPQEGCRDPLGDHPVPRNSATRIDQ